jgi:hypothetical protein
MEVDMGEYGGIEALRERMRDAAAGDYATGALGEAEFEAVLDGIALVESETDVRRLGLVRFALVGEDGYLTGPASRGDIVPSAPTSPVVPARSEFTFIGSSRHVLRPGESGIAATLLLGDMRVDCRDCGYGRVDLDLVCLLGDVVVEAPADAVVLNEMTTILGDFKDRVADPGSLDPRKVLRLTGFHLIGDLKVKRY